MHRARKLYYFLPFFFQVRYNNSYTYIGKLLNKLSVTKVPEVSVFVLGHYLNAMNRWQEEQTDTESR